jgi:4'-phosphopantetheinyl transferase
MCDPVVYLYVTENRKDLSTEEKVRIFLSRFLSDSGVDLHHEEDQPLILRTPRGKPYLPSFPGLHLSITHSGKWFICAFSAQPVGIDLQEHSLLRKETPQQAYDRYAKIARRFFHSNEATYVETDPKENFFPVWAAKESYVKFTGQGMDQFFDAFCVWDPYADPARKIPENTTWQAENAFFRQKRFDETCTFCMCTATPCTWQWIIAD